jgi:hypothetical protein
MNRTEYTLRCKDLIIYTEYIDETESTVWITGFINWLYTLNDFDFDYVVSSGGFANDFIIIRNTENYIIYQLLFEL